jgi:peptidyl-prolyl cis-trans isomerase B (cyclophilin B)
VPTNKRQKELARRRAERQATRRAQEKVRRRKRRVVAAVTVLAVGLGVLGIIVLAASLKSDKKKDDASATPTPTASASPDAFKSFPVACGAKRPAEAKGASFSAKTEPPMTIKATKKYTMTMKTSCGPLVFELDPKKAPHTVNSFVFLASKNFYDGSICHRMNDAPDFAFLQCGDPSGTGAGQAPGYTLAEENTTGAKYTRGTLAMANTGQPHSTGAQFFLLDKDATSLPPNYTVAGHITAGIENLDKIIAAGTDKAFEPSPGGGHPKQAVYLEDVTVVES